MKVIVRFKMYNCEQSFQVDWMTWKVNPVKLVQQNDDCTLVVAHKTPEVFNCVIQRTLSDNEGIFLSQALQTSSRTIVVCRHETCTKCIRNNFSLFFLTSVPCTLDEFFTMCMFEIILAWTKVTQSPNLNDYDWNHNM